MSNYFTLQGVSADVELGKDGAHFKWDGTIFQFRNPTDTAFVAGQFLSVIAPRIGTTDATSFFIKTNDVDRLEFDSSGDLGVGTAAGATHNFAFERTVAGNSIFLIENTSTDATAETDLWLRSDAGDFRVGITSVAFPGWTGDAFVELKQAKRMRFFAPTQMFVVDGSLGTVWTDTAVPFGIGTAAVPHGGVGMGLFAIEGADSSTSGPHVQYTTATNDFPLFQQRNWAHNDIQLAFDAYYDGTNWRASVNEDLFAIAKTSTELQFWAASEGFDPGDTFSWSTVWQMTAGGAVTQSGSLSAMDFTAVNGGASGSRLAGPLWLATGTDANITLTLTPKGTGNVVAGGQALESTGGRVVNVTATALTTFNAAKTDYMIAVSPPVGGTTVNLDAAPVAGQTYVISDVGGTAATRNITISGNGFNVDGAGSTSITAAYGSVTVIYDGTIWKTV